MNRAYKLVKYWVHTLRIVLLAPPFLLFAYFAYARPDLSLAIALPSSVPGFMLILLALVPAGRVRLGDASQKKPLLHWLGGVFLSQIVIAWMLLSHSLAFIGLGPEFIKGTINMRDAWMVTQDYLFNQWGIFPWGVYAFWGVSLAFFTYNKGGVPFHHRHAAVFWRGLIGSIGKLMTETVIILATALAVLLSIAGSFILMYQGLRVYLQWPDYFETLFPNTFIYSFTILAVFIFARKNKMREWVRKGATMNTLLWVSLGVAMILLTISSFFGDWIKGHIPFPLPFQTCDCVQRYEQAGPDLRFAIAEWSWLLLWTPIMGSLIAMLSIGRTIREVVAAVMFVPFMLYLLLLSGVNFTLPNLQLPWIYLLVGMITFLISAWVLKGKNTSQFFITGFMPVPSNVKTGVTSLEEGTKIHGLSQFGQRFLLGPLAVLFIHTMGGWLLIQFPMVVLGPIIIIKTYLCMVWALIYQLFKDGAMRYHKKK